MTTRQFAMPFVALALAAILLPTTPIWAIEYVKSIPEPGSGSRSGGLLGVPFLGGVQGVKQIDQPGAIPSGQIAQHPSLAQGSNWQPSLTGPGQSRIAYVDRSVAWRAAQHGFLISGTSGRSAEGYVEYIQWQPARVGAGHATSDGRHLVGVELGAESGWIRLDPRRAAEVFQTAQNRIVACDREMRDLTSRTVWLTQRFLASTDLQERQAIVNQTQQITQRHRALLDMRAAEVNLQKTLRP